MKAISTDKLLLLFLTKLAFRRGTGITVANTAAIPLKDGIQLYAEEAL